MVDARGSPDWQNVSETSHEGDAVVSAENPHWGEALDEFLAEEGIRETARTEALIRVVAWSLAQEMERQGLTKAALAERMETRAGRSAGSRRMAI
jgi:hypothetical protein